MRVLVDTSVWSLALRRRPGHLQPTEEQLRDELADLVRDGRVVMIGPIRQELLSGVRTAAEHTRLQARLRAFEDEPLVTADFEAAAEAHNRCRAAGVAGSTVDFLICAAAGRRGLAILSTDRDFERYAPVLGLRLHRPADR
jgi:predicted nucleic acid-binding protein